MTWPTTDVATTHADSELDSPAAARSSLLDLIQKFNQLRAHVTSWASGFLSSASQADARTALGASAVGVSVFTAADQAAAREAIGGTTVGSQLLTAADAAAARAAIEVADATNDTLQPIAASVSGNALTLTLNPTVLTFRSGTLTSGAVNIRSIASAISVTVPAGATLGTVSGAAARLAILAVDNGGTVYLAVANAGGAVALDESGLISTTALSDTADSASVIYSTSGAGSAMPFRLVGFVDTTQTSAGTWAVAPSLVQGAGGEGRMPMSGRLVNVQRIISSGTYTRTAGATRGFVEMQGGGGGSGSCVNGGGPVPPAAQGRKAMYWVSSLPATASVVIGGGGGGGGTNTGSPGSVGGTTSMAGVGSAAGGAPGIGANVQTYADITAYLHGHGDGGGAANGISAAAGLANTGGGASGHHSATGAAGGSGYINVWEFA